MTTLRTTLVAATVAAAAMLLGFFGSSPARAASDHITVESALQSAACNGSCIELLRTQSQLFLQVRDPETGRIFKLVPLDLGAEATVGPLTTQPLSQGSDTAKRSVANGDASVKSVPNPPMGGTGTVRETAPFSDDKGNGEIEITCVFVDHRLQDVVIQKVYFRLRPA
ncbi:MAG: hypothetical protein IT477_03995 [Rhodanobacteraceae bacterium]|nr:hypothetical protein [Rhodanobacteraceae bacterium]MDL1868191.1 hypothetical protein [Gammaproteobacteria bacterium PRO6]